MGPQPVLFQICFYKGLGEPQENTLEEPLAFLLHVGRNVRAQTNKYAHAMREREEIEIPFSRGE